MAETSALDVLKEKVAKNRSLVGSVVALVHGIVAELNKLREVGATADQISALANDLEAQDIDLANAILEGTNAESQQVPTGAVAPGAATKAEIIEAADPNVPAASPAPAPAADTAPTS